MKRPLFTLISILFIIGASTPFSCQQPQTQNAQPKTFHTPSLFLLSKGFENDSLKAAFLDFINLAPARQRIAVIPNATNKKSKQVKKTQKAKGQFAEMGLDSSLVDLFDITQTDPQGLHAYDIIYILGGNPFVLLDHLKQTGTDSVLIRLAQEGKILMGYSAGALILGPNLELMNEVDSLLGFNEMGLQNLDCLGLYDFVMFPHFEDFTSQVEGLAEVISHYEARADHKIYRLNDNQGIAYKDGKVRMIP